MKIHVLWQSLLVAFGTVITSTLLVSIVFSTTTHAVQSVPYQMNFQGRLNDSTGAPMPNGTYNMIFRIYSGSTGGTALWSETHAVSASQGVTITTGGLFSVQLGSVTSLPSSIFNSSSPLYLEIELPTPATATGSSPSWTEGAMSPRNPIESSPYAINSDLLDGMDSSSFAQATGGTGYIQNQTASPQTASFSINGTGSILGSSTTAFQVQNASGAAILTVDTTGNNTNVMGNLNISQVSAPATAPSVAAGAAGSLTGTFYYVVTYMTNAGETNPGTVSSAVTVTSQQVNLTAIPTSSNSSVIGRRIYRGTGIYGPFNLVTTIANNTATTYTDNVTSLGAVAVPANTTASLQQNGSSILTVDNSQNIALGQNTLSSSTSYGSNNTAVGSGSLGANTNGSNNSAFGIDALSLNTSGTSNTSIGDYSMYSNTTGSYNIALGDSSLGSNVYGFNNTGIGRSAGECDDYAWFCTSGGLQNATAIGAFAQVQANNTLVLGSVDDATKVVVGATVPLGTNTFGVSPVDLNSQFVTASQTSGSGTITASGAIFSAANVGEIFVWSDGTTETITAYTDSTHVTGSSTTITESASYFRTHHVGLQVTSAGNVYVQNNSTAAFSVQNASSAAILTVDTTGNNTNVMGNLNISQVSAPATAPTVAAGAAGSLTGTFYYIVTYVTAAGETDPGTVSSPVTVASQQVNLTAIPTSASAQVTARKLYRGTSSSGPFQLVTTLSNNTATTYTDNITSLGAVASSWNTTAGLQQNGSAIAQVGTTNTALGLSSLKSNTTGVQNTATGASSLYSNTTGNNNTATGASSLRNNTTGYYNTASGYASLYNNTGGYNNTASGYGALYSNTTGFGNTALGYLAGYQDSSAKFKTGATIQNATAIGAYAQVQANNTLVLGSVDTSTQIVVGATVPVGTNSFGVSPVDLNSTSITASQTSGSGTITASGAIFSASNVGEMLVWADGTTETITAYTDSTHVTGSSTTITESASYFRTHHIGFQVTGTGNAYVQNNSATGFYVQNASGVAALNVDTTTNTITLGSSSSGNYLSFTASGGLVAYGTAQHTKTILLPAEYTGAVLDAASDATCSSADSGTMTSAYDSTNRMNYYNWTSSSGTAQCYDVVVQVPIPADFAGWSGTPDIRLMKDSTGTGAYALEIIPSSGTDANYSSYVSPGTLSTSWANMATSALSGTYTAGDYMTIKVRVSSTSGANVKLGNIKLTYYSSF